jgi:ABC-type multidrug transport system ATPase subunit
VTTGAAGARDRASQGSEVSVPPLLRLTNVSRTYGRRRALLPISLTVAAGSCLAVIGENGSGKSTLLRIAAGRDTPTSGKVEFDGAPMRDDDPATRARVAVVGDTNACYPDLTVREHLRLVAVAHGVEQDAGAWIEWALEQQRLREHADALPGSLSSGQTQALLLAAALVRPRDLLILDEPEQRLDPEARERLADRLRAEKADGVAVLLATHHVELARAVADRVIVLDEGRVLREGAPARTLTP